MVSSFKMTQHDASAGANNLNTVSLGEYVTSSKQNVKSCFVPSHAIIAAAIPTIKIRLMGYKLYILISSITQTESD